MLRVHYNYNKPPLYSFFILLIFSLSIGTAHAYIDDTFSVMQKKSNNEFIYVLLESVDTLAKRNYADPLIELNNCMKTDTNQSEICQFKLSSDKICFFFTNNSDTCFTTLDKPAHNTDCKKFFKFYSIFPISPVDGDGWYVQNYSVFARNFCELSPEYNYGEIKYQIANHKLFVEKYGIPYTIKYNISSWDDTDPQIHTGRGSFSSHEKYYEFGFREHNMLLHRFYIYPDNENDCMKDYDETNLRSPGAIKYEYFSYYFCTLDQNERS